MLILLSMIDELKKKKMYKKRKRNFGCIRISIYYSISVFNFKSNSYAKCLYMLTVADILVGLFTLFFSWSNTNFPKVTIRLC